MLVLVDSNVILDIFAEDKTFFDCSLRSRAYGQVRIANKVTSRASLRDPMLMSKEAGRATIAILPALLERLVWDLMLQQFRCRIEYFENCRGLYVFV